jgi:putative SOS response-associated peptidase YedK
MCNLYSMTRPQDAMRKLFGLKHDRAGNLPSLPGIFPDQLAPVVYNARNGERSLELMRWGFPPPPRSASGGLYGPMVFPMDHETARRHPRRRTA